MEFRKEWLVEGKRRGTGKWYTILSSVEDNTERGLHKFRSYEEAVETMKKRKAREDLEIAHHKRKDTVIGDGFSVSTEYYSEYDIIEWRVLERQVSKWYVPQEVME